jgi:hypothetical protein
MPPAKPLAVGVPALQGDAAEHLRALEAAGARPLAVRTPADPDETARLIIPGGESTTISKLAEPFGLAGPLRMRVASGMPVFGSCAGMIMRWPACGPGQRPANARASGPPAVSPLRSHAYRRDCTLNPSPGPSTHGELGRARQATPCRFRTQLLMWR